MTALHVGVVLLFVLATCCGAVCLHLYRTDGVALTQVSSHPKPLLSDEVASHLAEVWVWDAAVKLRWSTGAMPSWHALQKGASRPGLDPSWCDAQGLPMFTARVAGIDTDVHAMCLQQPTWSVPVARAVVLLSPVLNHLLDAWMALRSDAPQGPARPGDQHCLVRLLMPAHWSEHERLAVREWAQRRWAQHKPSTSPEADGIGGMVGVPRWCDDVLASPESLWAELDRCWAGASHADSAAWCMVLALDSALDRTMLSDWDGAGELFTAHNPFGCVPGEGAAGLMLSRVTTPSGVVPAWLSNTSWPTRPTCLHRPFVGQQPALPHQPARLRSLTLQAGLAHMADPASQPGHLGVVVLSDADHRASRSTEVHAALHAAMPELDAVSQLLCLGESCGELGMVRAVAPLALAHAVLQPAAQGPTEAWVLLVQSAQERVVLRLKAWAPQDPAVSRPALA